MISNTPHVVVGPFSDRAAGIALKAVSAKFGPVEVELTHAGQDRTWLLILWPKAAPDKDTQLKVLGFCHGAAWASEIM